MRKYFSEFRVEPSQVNICQVWSYDTRDEIGGYKLEYETSSQAKASAVSEYLNAKAEQISLDQYATPECYCARPIAHKH
jgi:hypothetical protein